MENNVLEPPKRLITNFRVSRLASIYFNMTMTCVLLAIFATISSFIIPVFYGLVMLLVICFLILMFFLVIITFGLILLVPNNPIRVLLDFIQNANTDKVMVIAQKFFSVLPYLCIAGLVAAVIAIVSVSFTKEKKVGRIIGICIAVVVLVFMFSFYYVMGGQLWQN